MELERARKGESFSFVLIKQMGVREVASERERTTRIQKVLIQFHILLLDVSCCLHLLKKC